MKGLSLKSYLLIAFAISTTTAQATIQIPVLKPGFEFSVAALALKPAASNLNYAILNKELPAQSPTWTERELKPNYAPAFGVGARYIFSNQGSDIKLYWTHLNSTTTASVNADNVDYFIGPDYEIGPAGVPIRSALGKVQFKYDVVNLELGQFIAFSYIEARFFGGLSTGFLRQNLQSTFNGNVITGAYQGPFSTTSYNKSSFTGIGPRVGMDLAYNINSGWSILGEGALSALIGKSQATLDYTSSAVQLQTLFGQSINYQSITDQQNTQVIPGIDTKLAIRYAHALQQALFTITLGYQAAVYINVINQYMPGTLVTPLETGGIFVATMNHTNSNYSVQGPYLEFTLQM